MIAACLKLYHCTIWRAANPGCQMLSKFSSKFEIEITSLYQRVHELPLRICGRCRSSRSETNARLWPNPSAQCLEGNLEKNHFQNQAYLSLYPAIMVLAICAVKLNSRSSVCWLPANLSE